MDNTKNKRTNGQGVGSRPALGWLEREIREVNFGTIRGIRVVDGVMSKGPKFRRTLTGKPKPSGASAASNVPAGQKSADRAMADLVHATSSLKNEWSIKIKVANGIPQSWEMDELRPSADPANN